MGKKHKTKPSGKAPLNNNFFFVNKVHATRRLPDGTEECFVSWVGYPQSENSWVRKETVMEKKTFDKGIYDTLSISKRSSEREGSSSLRLKKLTKYPHQNQSDSSLMERESESEDKEDSSEYGGISSNKLLHSGSQKRKNSERSQRLQSESRLKKLKKISKKQKGKNLSFCKEFHFDFQSPSEMKNQTQYSFKIEPLNTKYRYGVEMREEGVQTEDLLESTLRRLKRKRVQFDLPCLTNHILQSGAKRLNGRVLWY